MFNNAGLVWEKLVFMIKVSLIASAVVFAMFFPVPYTSAGDIYSYPRKTITVDGKQYRVLVADRTDRREQGLSGTAPGELRKHKVDGMLFVFDRDDDKTFQGWYMQYDLFLLSLKKMNNENELFTATDRAELKVGTITKITGRYILELPKAVPKKNN